MRDVLAGSGANGTQAVASGQIPVPTAQTSASASVPGLTIATYYDVYLVGEDTNTKPNIMTQVTFLGRPQPVT